MRTSPGNRTSLSHHEDGDKVAEASVREHNLHKRKVVADKKLPIFGNFQRYYHIRNPVRSHANGQTDTKTVSHTDQLHPALALDSRLGPILNFLERRCVNKDGTHDSEHTEWMFKDVLDVGCNSGKITIHLAQALPNLAELLGHTQRSVRIIGVDIDPSLIQQAEKAARVARSLFGPSDLRSGIGKTVSQEPELPKCLSAESAYFPGVFPTLFGTIPEDPIDDHEFSPPSKKMKKQEDKGISSEQSPLATRIQSPYLEFYAGDWVDLEASLHQGHFTYSADDISKLHEKDLNQYDLILALSLTKWVHIHHGDAGLARFFARISQSLRPGGILILERQEWKSYDQARRMTSETKQKIRSLKMRPEGDFDWLLDRVGLGFVEKIGVGVGAGFQRPLEVFEKKAHADEMADSFVESLLHPSLGARSTITFPWVTRASSFSSTANG